MALEVWREYQGTFELVGAFSGDDQGGRTFCYAKTYLAKSEACALSHSLPLRESPYARTEYAPFFEGLVPESPVRAELSMRFQIPQSDYLGLLERLGFECTGALMFKDSEMDVRQAAYRDLTLSDWEGFAASSAPAVAESMRASRLSLAGAQTKTGWYLAPDNNSETADLEAWKLPVGSAPSTHIIKFARDHVDVLPANEWVCMRAAQACGVETAHASRIDALPNAIAVRRYDRVFEGSGRVIDGSRAPLRLHQEDFCQALGLPPYAKYEVRPDTCYMRMCGNLIRSCSADAMADLARFARQVLVDYALGNCDAHLKNHALLYDASWSTVRLAPAYDIVSTTVLGYDRKMGIDIGDHRIIDEVEAEDFTLAAEDLRISPRMMGRLAHEVADSMGTALDALSRERDSAIAKMAARIQDDATPRLAVLRGVA